MALSPRQGVAWQAQQRPTRYRHSDHGERTPPGVL